LGRSHAYQTGSGNWTNHNFYHAPAVSEFVTSK
jgi:hypothetical protein